MIIAQPAGAPGVAARPRLGVRPDGNAADQQYLEESAAALGPIMAACEAGAARSPRPDVRVLVDHREAVILGQFAREREADFASADDDDSQCVYSVLNVFDGIAGSAHVSTVT